MLRPYDGDLCNWATEALLIAFQAAEIEMGGIFEAYPVVLTVLGENSLQFFHHRREIRIVRGGNEGAAAETSGDAFEIKFLEIWQRARVVRDCAKEIVHVLLAWIAFFHAGVVRAEGPQQGFVAEEKRSGVCEALVPNDDNPARGLENASEFGASGVLVEPMEGLAGGDEIDACVIEGGGFGGSVDAGEAVVGSQIFFACLAHGFVGLDAEDAIAIFEEEFAQKTGA